jgi:2-deoxy-D-gluconate 3-dehydrogenase
VAGRNSTKNGAAIEELSRIGAVASGIVVDVTIETECQAMVAEAVERYERLDILVNNAGVGQSHPPQETTMAVWRSAPNTNLTGATMCSQAAYPEMKKTAAASSSPSGPWRPCWPCLLDRLMPPAKAASFS